MNKKLSIMGQDMRFEMMKVLKGRQDRMIYYIAGLNVASIGFTLSKTFDIIPDEYDIALGLALLFWIISIIASFRWIFIQFRTMEINLAIKTIKDDKMISEINKRNHINKSMQQLVDDNKSAEKAISRTLFFFIAGVVSFVFWRFLEVFQF